MGSKEYQKERHALRKEQGLCIYCSNKSVGGKSTCCECREKQKLNRRKKILDNCCIQCGDETSGATLCVKCSEKRSECEKNRRAIRKSSGLCIFCSNPIVKGKTLCHAHLLSMKEKNKLLREQRFSNGLCQSCGGDSLTGSTRLKTSYCEGCYLKSLSRSQFGTSSRADELKFLFTENSICPYTGISLTLGVNASLDHIIPKARGGTNEIDNLQYVYSNGAFDVNRMKGEMSEEEFKQAIQLIFQNYLQ